MPPNLVPPATPIAPPAAAPIWAGWAGPLLWVGLGNPEPEMAMQRHNIGFMAIDAIAARHGFGPWRNQFKGLVATGQLAGRRIVALKPRTYMNASGEAVQEAAAFYKLPPAAILALHDDLDLAPGRLRIKRGGGAAGHNGLRSMDRMLGSTEYWRVRLGIGHPGERQRVLGHVLGNFTPADRIWLADLLAGLADNAALLAEGRPDAVMNRMARDRNIGEQA